MSKLRFVKTFARFAAFGTAQPLPPPAAPNLAPKLDTPPSVKCSLKLARFHAKCSRRAFIAEGVQHHHTAAAFIQRANGKAHRLAHFSGPLVAFEAFNSPAHFIGV